MTLPPAADEVVDAVVEAALVLESRRCYGKPLSEIVSAVEVVQTKLNAARAVLYPLLEKELEVGR